MKVSPTYTPLHARSSVPVVVEPVRRFEAPSASGSKFWQVEILEGTRYSRTVFVVKVVFGKFGTTGSANATEFTYKTTAVSFVNRKIAEKLGKGYRQITSTGPMFLVQPKILTTASIKKMISTAANDIKKGFPSGINAEVIITVITDGEVFQESVK